MTHIGRVAPHGHPPGGAGHRNLMNHRGNRLKNNQSRKGIQDAGIQERRLEVRISSVKARVKAGANRPPRATSSSAQTVIRTPGLPARR